MSGTASADPIAEFYKGKNLNWILSAGAGGGYASYAHAFAPFLSAHIPGKPHIVVQNMPGAGGIRAMLYLNSVAPKDGTTIGMVHSSVPFAPLYGIRGANFDPRADELDRQHHLGLRHLRVLGEVRDHQWEHMFEREFIVGGTGAGSQMETMPTMLKQLFGAKVKVISGYKGGNDVYIAMERGEVHGRCGGLVSSIKATRPDWFPEKKVAVPIQIALERDPEFPDSPAVIEFVKDERTRQILEVVLSPMEMDRPILAPPGTVPERVAALRKAFSAAMRDPGFIAEAKRAEHRDQGNLRRARRRGAPPRLFHAAGGHQGRQRGDEPDRDDAVASASSFAMKSFFVQLVTRRMRRSASATTEDSRNSAALRENERRRDRLQRKARLLAEPQGVDHLAPTWPLPRRRTSRTPRGPIGIGVKPCASNTFLVSGMAIVVFHRAGSSFWITGCGVPLGAISPNQSGTSKSEQAGLHDRRQLGQHEIAFAPGGGEAAQLPVAHEAEHRRDGREHDRDPARKSDP